nr:MAG TPA: hypothetical protein [Caudoviricetes sp.]
MHEYALKMYKYKIKCVKNKQKGIFMHKFSVMLYKRRC